MKGALAIFVPQLGTRSETFIRRHIEELRPGQTAVVAGTASSAIAGHWDPNCPVLLLDRIGRLRLRQQFVSALLEKFGWLLPDTKTAAIRKYLKLHNVTVALGEYLDLSLPWLELCRELGIRFYAHAHGYDVSARLREPIWRAEYRRYNLADGIITINQGSKRRLIELGVEADKIHIVPYGIQIPEEAGAPSKGDYIRCLAVGRMVAKKAPILTLDAFRRAALTCPKLRLDYVGEGELYPAVRDYIRAMALDDKVTLHGGQPHEKVRELMAHADIFIQHSVVDAETGDEEGLPVAILEAMAAGLPVVSTRHAGIPEAVVEGSTGYLVDEGDVAGMAARIDELAADPELRQAMGKAGWRRARECFSDEREIAQLRSVMGIDSE